MHRLALATRLPQSTEEWTPFLRRALARPIAAVHYPKHFYLYAINKRGTTTGFSPQKSPMAFTPGRESAVLLLLSPTTTSDKFQDMCITLTMRTDKVGSHKNQMSFPGGRVDAGESSEAAAQREALEETGLLPNSYDVIAPITPITTNKAGQRVTPFVAVSPSPAQPYCASVDEVRSVHYLHLSSLLFDASSQHARVIKYRSFSSKWPSYFPCFFTSRSQGTVATPVKPSAYVAVIEDDNGFEPMLSDDYPGELVWGLTSFMTCELVARLANELVDGDRAAVEALLTPSNVVARDPLDTPLGAAATSQGSD